MKLLLSVLYLHTFILPFGSRKNVFRTLCWNDNGAIPWLYGSQKISTTYVTRQSRHWPWQTPCELELWRSGCVKRFWKIWRQTGDQKYVDYIKKIIDPFINADGTIRTYELNEYNSDQVTAGLQLLFLCQHTFCITTKILSSCYKRLHRYFKNLCWNRRKRLHSFDSYMQWGRLGWCAL